MTWGLTLVTGVWSPGGLRRSVVRSGAVYARLLEELLLLVEGPLVVLVDPPLRADVDRSVQGALRRCIERRLPSPEVTILERPLGSLPFVRDLATYERFQRPGHSATRKDSVDFSLMTWAKAELVREIAASNLCDTSHVGWIDAGIMHVADSSTRGSAPNPAPRWGSRVREPYRPSDGRAGPESSLRGSPGSPAPARSAVAAPYPGPQAGAGFGAEPRVGCPASQPRDSGRREASSCWDEIEETACSSDRIRILQRMASAPDEVDDPDHWYAWNVARVAGGLITMPRAGSWRLAEVVQEEAERAASVERFALEEQLLAAAETRHPELFERYYGDYFGILTNVRYIRRDLETVLANLSHCRAWGIPVAGAEVARALLRSATEGRLRLEPGEAVVLLDDGIACLRDAGDLVAARSLASLAAGLRAASATTRYALQMQRERATSIATAIRELDVDTTSTTNVLAHEDLAGFLSML